MRIAPFATPRTNEKRVSHQAMNPTAAVARPTPNVEPLKSSKGLKKGLLGQTSISFRNPTATAGKAPTASAAARPPGTHHQRRRSSHEAAANQTKKASAARKIQRPLWLSGIAWIRS